MNQPLTPAQVNHAFIAAQPLISSEIKVLEAKFPNYIRDFYKVSPFPLGSGTSMTEITYKGSLPQVERGFSKWRKLNNSATGCTPCDGPDCAYNTSALGGGGFERKVMELMDREFVSGSFCVKEIATTLEFEKVMQLIVNNLYTQIAFFKEQNIGFNALISLAKKMLVDSGGVKVNPQDPYNYRTIGSVRLSALNLYMLRHFYERIRKMNGVEPVAVSNGRPIYNLFASDELLSRIYRDDPQAREDLRNSSMADSLISTYGFNSTIQGMFIPVPYQYVRRFNIVGGEAVEVNPWLHGIPLEVGEYSTNNPDYENATHEGVIISGASPFEIFTLSTPKTLGGGTEFGPEGGSEPTMFDNWEWMNFRNDNDPYGRMGYFMTSGTIGISNQFSPGIFEILVERPRSNTIAVFYPEPVCPPTAVECDNEVADMGCPCPYITSISTNPLNGNQFIQLSTPYTLEEEQDTVLIELTNGGYVLVDIEGSDIGEGTTVTVLEVSGTTLNACDVVGIWCVDSLSCSALVRSWDDKGLTANYVSVVLSDPLKAVTAADVVVVTLGDGTVIEDAQVVSASIDTNTWVINLGQVVTAANCGVVSVCVPTATDAACPGCDSGVTFETCEEEAE